MFVTDITNCYCAIYTHTIAWGIDGEKEQAKRKNAISQDYWEILLTTICKVCNMVKQMVYLREVRYLTLLQK